MHSYVPCEDGDRDTSVNSIVEQDINTIVKEVRQVAEALEGKVIVISGGAGFLGTYIVASIQHMNNHVFHRPCKVIVLDNYITGSRKTLFEEYPNTNITFIDHDVRLPINIDGDVDYILHAAGIASPIYYRRFPIETIEAAVSGTKNLLELACRRSVKSFVYFSSSEIYGDPDPRFLPIPESYRGNVSCTGPRACYDESKRLGETLCTVFHQIYGVSVKIIRPFNVYGPGMKTDDYRVIPSLLTRALESKALQVFGLGIQTRAFCYVTDAVGAILKVLLSGRSGEAYNVGNDQEEIGMLALARMAAELFDNNVTIDVIDYPENYPKDEPQRRVPDLTKIRTELDYRPQVDLQTGLRRTLEWFKAVPGISRHAQTTHPIL